jgi:predicted outer membrane repeat protein
MKLSCVCAVLAAAASVGSAFGATLFVDNNSGDAYNPPSGSTVYTTIQSAIDAAAQSGDTIQVYPGSYTSTAAEVVNLKGKALVLEAAIALEQGTPATHATIDGQDARRCIVATLNETSSTIVRGLRIHRGRASAGAGMYVVNGSPGIDDCWFTSNVATGGVASGGALRLLNSRSVITGCDFHSNSAGAEGGAVFNANGAVWISGCDFVANTSPRGGGLFTRDDASVVESCTFRDTVVGAGGWWGLGVLALDSRCAVNSCTFSNLRLVYPGCCGGGINSGAGVQILGSLASVTLSNCTFVGNFVGNTYSDRPRGAALSVGQSGNNRGSARVLGCLFQSNVSEFDGGAIAMQSADLLEIDGLNGARTVFENNSAGRFGGAISLNVDFVYESTFRLDDCRFAGNGAGSAGGALWIRQNGYAPAMSRILTDSVFLTNSAANGGALYLEGVDSRSQLARNAFCGNDPSDLQGSYESLGHNCFTTACQDGGDADDLPDTCNFPITDCNGNNIDDGEELVNNDINNDGVPDDCQPNLTFAGLSTEIVPILNFVSGLPSTSVCWRVYANFRDRLKADPPLLAQNGTVTAIYGNEAHPLNVSSAAGFFQAPAPNPDGVGAPIPANTAEDIPCGTIDIPLRYDSFLTIDAQCRSQGNLQLTPGLSFVGFNASTNSVFGTSNGAIFVNPDDPGSRAGEDGKVLLMQLTTKSVVRPTATINLRGRVDVAGMEIWDAFALPIPAPVVTAAVDCNGNGVHDALEIASGLVRDCNVDGIPDSCQSGGLANDCDGDGTPDACEIIAGTATDTNSNGVPDNCECQGDVDQNGAVNVDDLLEVFATWGMTGSGLPADVDGNGVVGPGDIALVLAGWGICL